MLVKKIASGAINTGIKTTKALKRTSSACIFESKAAVDTFSRRTSVSKGVTSVPFSSNIFGKNTTELTKDFFDRLSPGIYKEYLDVLSFDAKLHADSILIGDYGELFYNSLQKIFRNKKIKVIGIGQSPAVLTEYLKLRGVDATSIPISDLGKVHDNMKSIIGTPGAKKYLKYLKNFGFDVEKLDKETIYLFTDYAYSGRSLDNCKFLMDAMLPKDTKKLYFSIQDIVSRGNMFCSPAEKNTITSFEHNLSSCETKKRYSHLFRMPVTELKNIEAFHKEAQSSQSSLPGKLKLLLYDRTYKHQYVPRHGEDWMY